MVQIGLVSDLPVQQQEELLSRLLSWFPKTMKATGQRMSSFSPLQTTEYSSPHSVGIWVVHSDQRTDVHWVMLRDGKRRTLQRSLPGALNEEQKEALAQVVHYSAIALWQGGAGTEQEAWGPPLSTEESAPTGVDERLPIEEPAPTAVEERSIEEESIAEGETAPRLQARLTPEEEPRFPKAALPVAPPPNPAPPRTPAPQKQLELPHKTIALSLGYGFNLRPGEAPAHGPELAVSYFGDLLGGTLATRWLVPAQFQVEDTVVELTGARVRLSLETLHKLGAGWTLAPALGGGIDVVSWQVVSTSLANASEQVDVRPYLLTALNLRKTFGKLAVGVQALLDMSVAGTRYTKGTSGEDEELVTPSPFNPGGSVFLEWQMPI